jgi:hypothetical protein
MISWIRLIAVCSCLVVVPSLACAQGWDLYIGHYRGPYRGQVIDADTRAPLVGAVVVARWTRDRIYPLHSLNEHYAVREVLTDSEGRFVIDARDVEENAPKRTRHPEFRIFLPGYGAYPKFQRAPRGFTGGIFWGAGTTVELPRLESRQQRIESLYLVVPHNFSEQPFSELPLLIRAFNEERIALGMDPLSAPEKVK